MTHSSMQARVLAAMPPAPAELTAKQIHERIGEWAFSTIRHALRELTETGEVVLGGSHQSPTFRRAK